MVTPVDKKPLQCHLVMSSNFVNIEVAERALVDLCTEAGCGSDDEYWIVTALREALANAIRHGNKLDPALTVDLRMTIDCTRVEIRIRDEGEGFDPEDVPDPTDAANLLRPSGRGIFYMNQFMTHVEISNGSDGGTEVYMVRELAQNTVSGGEPAPPEKEPT